MKTSFRILAVSSVLGALAGTAFAQTYSVTDLGPLSGAPTYAASINDSGAVGGYARPDANSARAWIWKNGFGFTDAGSLGGADNRGVAVSAFGRLYGTSQNASGLARGFVFDPIALTLTDLGSIAPGDAVKVAGVNAGGVVAGTTTTGGATTGFTLSGGAMTLLGALPGADLPATSAANAINDAGQVVGVGSWVNGGTRAFRTDAGGALVSLGTLGGNDSTATAINAAGQVVGYSVQSIYGIRAFIYFDGVGMTALSYLDFYHDSRAYGLNNAGDVVGTSVDASGLPHAVAWLGGGGAINDLNALIPPTSGWTLESASAINNGGDIVGYGRIGAQEHAFLLTRYAGPDHQAPIAVATATLPPYLTYPTISVAVKYWDNEKVVTATTQGVGTIRVRGPNFFDMPGTVSSWTTVDSQVVNTTYNVPAPGGTWGPKDNGTYEIWVTANRVSDLAGNKMPGQLIGTFTIGYQTAPVLTIAGIPTTATTGTPVNLTLTVKGSYPSAASDVFSYTIDWNGDGSDVQTVSGPTNTIVPHTYTVAGAWTVRVHGTDPHGVLSADSTTPVKVTFATAQLPVAEVLATPSSIIGPSVTVGAVNGGTMYFFGPPFDANTNTAVATWNYLTPGASIAIVNYIGGDSQTYAGAAVDSRNRVIVFGGSNGDGVVGSARSYPANGSVAALPSLVANAVTTTDNLGRIYAYYASGGVFYRYTAGTTGAGTWETLATPPGVAGPMSYDGGDRIIVFSATPAVYSISADAWTQPLTAPRAFGRSLLGADGLVYLTAPSVLWAFDPTLNTFAQVGTTNYDESSSVALKGTDGYIYFMGFGTVEHFDTRATTTRAPNISSTPSPTTIVQSVPWTYTIAASGKPRPTFTLDRGPAGMTVNATTGVVSWTPTLAQVGVQSAIFRTTNSTGTVGQLIGFSVLPAVPDTTPPTPPTNVVVSNVTSITADISWSPGTDDVGVVGYRFYERHVIHSPKGSGSTTYYTFIAATSDTSVQLGGRKPYTSYPYYLTSVDAAGNQSGYVAAGFMTTYIAPPGITNSNNGPNAGTFAVVGEAFTSYTFTGGGLPAATLAVVSAPAGAVWNSPAGTSGSFTWTPAAGQEGTATFTLSGTNTSGAITQSYTVPVYPAGTDLLAPSMPGSLVVDQVSWNSCRARWTASADNRAVTGYHLVATHLDSRLHTPPYNDQVVAADVAASVLQTTIGGLQPGTAYDIMVQAGDAAGNQSAPASTSITTLPQPFIAPLLVGTAPPSITGLVADAGGQTTITWLGSGYYWAFTVESSPDLVTWAPVAPASQWPSYNTGFSFTPDPALPRYFYRVQATPSAAP